MVLPLTLPTLNNPSSTKDRVFIILSSQYPLSLIEISNKIKKTFNISVSFQSVRKAVLQLEEEKVLVKEGKKFSFNKDWILSFIKFGNILQKHYFSTNKSSSRLEIGSNVTEYTLNSLVDLDYIWNGLIRKALSDKNSPKIITFKAVHFWFLIATLAQETELMKEMIKKRIKLYYICYGKTSLDKWTVDMYKQIGVHCISKPKPKGFKDGLNIGTYGDYIIQTEHPKEITNKINSFFSRCKKIEDASLTSITDIVTMKKEIVLQSIYNPVIAESIRKEVINEF